MIFSLSFRRCCLIVNVGFYSHTAYSLKKANDKFSYKLIQIVTILALLLPVTSHADVKKSLDLKILADKKKEKKLQTLFESTMTMKWYYVFYFSVFTIYSHSYWGIYQEDVSKDVLYILIALHN